MTEVAELAYTPTSWVDGVTPVNAANMNKIEAALGATDTALGNYVPIDSAVVAGTRVQANKLLSGHAQPAFRYLGDGKLEWGPGGSTAPDTNLYRSAATVLKTDSYFMSALELVARDGTPAARSVMGAVGPSGAPGVQMAGDTTLYRSAAGVLKTDGQLTGGSIACLGILYIGPSLDVYLQHTNAMAPDVRVTSSNVVAFTGYNCRSGRNAGWSNGHVFNFQWDGTNIWSYINDSFTGLIPAASDARLKKDVKPLASSWETVKALNPVSFRWRINPVAFRSLNSGEEPTFSGDDQTHVGFIAQEVQEQIPSGAVSPPTADNKVDPAQPMALSIFDILATVTKGLQEAMARIEVLEEATPA